MDDRLRPPEGRDQDEREDCAHDQPAHDTRHVRALAGHAK